MTTALIVGDAHGEWAFMKGALQVAVDANVDLVIQLGDFGFWPNGTFARLVNRDFTEAGMPLWVIRGNHDYTGDAYEYLKPPTYDPGLTLIADGWRTEIDGVAVGFLGGAVSVDQDGRWEDVDWWRDEITDDESVKYAVSNGSVDVWFTHDSVENPPNKKGWRLSPRIEALCEEQRAKMRTVFHSIKPRLHIHGHWHHRYNAPTQYGQVIGLNCNSSDALYLLDFSRS